MVHTMSTQTVDSLAGDDRSTDTVIGANVRALIRAFGVSQERAGALLGLKQGSMSRKLKGLQTWSAAEVETMASYLGVEISDLYSRAPLSVTIDTSRLLDYKAVIGGWGDVVPLPLPEAVEIDLTDGSGEATLIVFPGRDASPCVVNE